MMTSSPLMQLANGRYSLWLPSGSGGFARCDGLALADWNLDAIESCGGWSLFLRDDDTGQVAAFGDSSCIGGNAWQASGCGAELSLQLLGLDVHIEARVHGFAAVEVRMIRVHHPGGSHRRVSVFAAMPVALNWPEAQAGHPAFARLFVQTRHTSGTGTLTASRRPRANGETWAALHTGFEGPGDYSWDTDRCRFLGRGKHRGRPQGVLNGLSATAGNVLDPVFAMARHVDLSPGETSTFAFWMEVTPPSPDASTPVSAIGRSMALRALQGEHETWVKADVCTVDSLGMPAALLRDLLRPRVGKCAPSQSAAGSVDIDESRDRAEPEAALLMWNGCGGFSADGREYVIRLPATPEGPVLPPMPWINVMANEGFGTLVSETGAGCTWSVNSHQHRLTPWYNDPLRDPHGEAFFVRDRESGECWSPQAGPLVSPVVNEVRHGWGYSCFLQRQGSLEQELSVFVHARDPVKFSRLQIRNHADKPRHLRLYSFSRLVMGFNPGIAPTLIDVGIDTARHCLFATRRDPGEIGRRHAFATLVTPVAKTGWHGSGSRHGFLGDSGRLDHPWAVLSGEHPDDTVTPDDPAFIQSLDVVIGARDSVVVTFLLGDAATQEARDALLDRYTTDDAVLDALAEVRSTWVDRLTRVTVKTPETAIDVMLNGWLLYQTLSCRMLGRTALYQSSGAFGFRDQLQDSLAFLATDPEITKRQILLHASRQFIEGDVQHWWHEPPIDRGLRTRFADDLNWLPLAVAEYIERTGDHALLETQISFLEGPLLADGEDERYDRAAVSDHRASLYEHCCLALDRSLTKGPHGLPLMGTGDWNDGMNRIGRLGIGESVWMGFFLYDILGRFIPLCQRLGDVARSLRYQSYREHLFVTLNAAGWDGDWYRRAWYDNGHVVGSRQSDECRIDALAQAWSILSGVATGGRIGQVIAALDEYLIDPQARIVRLLTPPFANTADDPGYIKGYVAGVRENGGQYTHAAAWVVKAFAMAGRHERVADLFLATLPSVHASDAAGVQRLKTEPYVAVADVYGADPHVGRGGWSWYTGSSGWLHRVGSESLLGIRWLATDVLVVSPCIPDGWSGYQAVLKHGAQLDVHLVVRRVSEGGSTVVAASSSSVSATLAPDGARFSLMGQTGRVDVLVEVGARSMTHSPSASISTEQS
jgi:N,N'-diacetylchitobiose phosphorylase